MSIWGLDMAIGRMNRQHQVRAHWLRHNWFIYLRIPVHYSPLITYGESLPLAKPNYRHLKKIKRRSQ